MHNANSSCNVSQAKERNYPTVSFTEPESLSHPFAPVAAAAANKSIGKRHSATLFDQHSNNQPSVSVLYNDFMNNMLPQAKTVNVVNVAATAAAAATVGSSYDSDDDFVSEARIDTTAGKRISSATYRCW